MDCSLKLFFIASVAMLKDVVFCDLTYVLLVSEVFIIHNAFRHAQQPGSIDPQGTDNDATFDDHEDKVAILFALM